MGNTETKTMEKPSIEQVLQVIDALYSTQNVGGKEDASRWLESLQNSVRNVLLFHHNYENECDSLTESQHLS